MWQFSEPVSIPYNHVTHLNVIRRLENEPGSVTRPPTYTHVKTFMMCIFLISSFIVNIAFIGYLPLCVYITFYQNQNPSDNSDVQNSVKGLTGYSGYYSQNKNLACGTCSSMGDSRQYQRHIVNGNEMCCISVAESLETLTKLIVSEHKRQGSSKRFQSPKNVHFNLGYSGNYHGYRRLSWKNPKEKQTDVIQDLTAGRYTVALGVTMWFNDTLSQQKSTFKIKVIKETHRGHLMVMLRKQVQKIKGDNVFDNVLLFDGFTVNTGDEIYVVITEAEHVYKYICTTWLSFTRVD